MQRVVSSSLPQSPFFADTYPSIFVRERIDLSLPEFSQNVFLMTPSKSSAPQATQPTSIAETSIDYSSIKIGDDVFNANNLLGSADLLPRFDWKDPPARAHPAHDYSTHSRDIPSQLLLHTAYYEPLPAFLPPTDVICVVHDTSALVYQMVTNVPKRRLTHQCEICQKAHDRRSRSQACLNRHLQLKPFICGGACQKSNCGSKFDNIDYLQKHLRPENERYVLCPVCFKRISRQNLARHATLHRA